MTHLGAHAQGRGVVGTVDQNYSRIYLIDQMGLKQH